MIDSLPGVFATVVRSSSTLTRQHSTEPDRAFDRVLQDSQTSPASSSADILSGRLGIDYKRTGFPSQVVYFDEQGNKLASSSFNAKSILRMTDQLGISLADLKGLGEQLDALGVGYRPYELYPGTGSDHGVDFDDLMRGGLGSAYDWRQDVNAGYKGAKAQLRLNENQDLADRLNVSAQAEVTANRGIDPARFATLTGKDGLNRSYVAFNGQTASWHLESAQAQSVASATKGVVYQTMTGHPVLQQTVQQDQSVTHTVEQATPLPVSRGEIAQDLLSAQLRSLYAPQADFLWALHPDH